MNEYPNDKSIYPYARIKAMNEIMEFIRSPDWRPESIGQDLLKMLGIAPSKEREVIRAIRFLGLIDEAGKPTDRFDVLKTNYPHEIAIIVKEVYREVFDILPASLIDQERAVKYFMSSSTTSRDTAEYQGMFFKWACEEAGIELPKLPKGFKRARFIKGKE